MIVAVHLFTVGKKGCMQPQTWNFIKKEESDTDVGIRIATLDICTENSFQDSFLF